VHDKGATCVEAVNTWSGRCFGNGVVETGTYCVRDVERFGGSGEVGRYGLR
jgi:hypothetical protein